MLLRCSCSVFLVVSLLLLSLCLSAPLLVSAAPSYSRSQYVSDRQALLKGINSGSTFSWNGGLPGSFSIFGPTVLPLIQSTNTSTESTSPQYSALALSVDGGGRVCLWGHGVAFTPSPTYLDANPTSATLLSNCLQWSVAAKTTVSTNSNSLPLPRVLIHTGSSSTPSNDQQAFFKRNNFTVSNSMNIFTNPSALNSSIDVLAIQDGDFGSVVQYPERLAQVRNFLLNGGSLWLGACSWVFTAYGPGPLKLSAVNALLAPYGAISSDGAYWATSNIWDSTDAAPETNQPWWALNAIDNSTGTFNVTKGQVFISLLSNALNQIDYVYPIDGYSTGSHPAQFVLDASKAKYNSFCPANLLSWNKFPLVAGTHNLERFCVSLLHPLRQFFPLSSSHPMVAIASKVFPGQPVNITRQQATFTIEVNAKRTGWYSTGLYAWPGTVIRLTMLDYNNRTKIGNPGSMSIRVGCHTDSIFGSNSWARWPIISVSKGITSNQTDITTYAGGLIYIDVSNPLPSRPFNVTFQGEMIEAPLYRAGVTSLSDWLSTIRFRPAPFGEIEADDVILAQPQDVIQQVTDPITLVTFWNRVVLFTRELAQIDRKDHKERYTSDIQISAGWMHSGYPIMNYLASKSDVLTAKQDASTGIINTYNQWGIFHELGHNHQSGYWTFDGMGEVSVNFFSTYVEQRFPDGPSVFGDRDFGPRSSQRAAVNAYLANPDFTALKNDAFVFLVFFLDLQTGFGWTSFRELFKLYRTLPSNELPSTDDAKRDQWLTRFSTLVGRNVASHFQRFAIPVSAQAVANVSTLPIWDISQVVHCAAVRLPYQPCFNASTDNTASKVFIAITTWLPVRVNESLEIRFYPSLFASTVTAVNLTSTVTSQSRMLNPNILSWNVDYQQNPTADFVSSRASWSRNLTGGYDALRITATRFIDGETKLLFAVGYPSMTSNSTNTTNSAFQTSSLNRMSLSIINSKNMTVTTALRDTEDRVLEVSFWNPDSGNSTNRVPSAAVATTPSATIVVAILLSLVAFW